MNSNAIVTLADSSYFELLEELINSIKTHKESEKVSICVLDAGLTKEQSEIVKKIPEINKIMELWRGRKLNSEDKPAAGRNETRL